MSDDIFTGNDNVRPSRLGDLIATAVDDFVVRAEGDIEEGEERIEPGPALIELAATAVKEVVFEYQLDPKVVMRYVAGRLSSLCMTELEHSEPLRKPHLTLIKSSSEEPPQ
jgi:hypothetical protein